MTLSTYARGELIKHICRTGSFTKPAALYVALFKGDGSEISGGGYARTQHGPGDAFWRDQVGGNGQSSNIGAVTFPTPTGANWGIATSFKVMDDPTAGNVVGIGVLAAPKTINVGDDAPSFADGALVWSFT